MSEERSTPLHCPYCGEEDLRPYQGPAGQHGWLCRYCGRAFVVRLLGIAVRGERVAP